MSDAPFRYCAKAGRGERNAGCAALEPKGRQEVYGDGLNTATKCDPKMHTPEGVQNRPVYFNNHPTVKPVALLMWLSRLVIPKHRAVRVADPFAGSGSTLLAWELLNLEDYEIEGFGVDQDEGYCEIARARLAHVRRHGVKWLEVRRGEVDKRQGVLF